MNINNFSNNLKYLRAKHNLNQNDLAYKIGVSRQTISNYENGSRYPDFVVLVKIAEFFNCSIDELVFHNTPINISSLNNLSEIDLLIKKFNTNLNFLDTLKKNKSELEDLYKSIPKRIDTLKSLDKITYNKIQELEKLIQELENNNF